MKTPLGNFRIVEKIGHKAAPGTVFKARVPLGQGEPLPDTEDFITSRILWLDGIDEHNANTRGRFIYIHGTRHEKRIGVADSHGCVRMRNADVIELFDLVDETTQVVIRE
jgi:lipoprotein-anchoring transpeptidase ErfK/SrfK